MAQRNTATRDKHRAIIARGAPECALCHGEIDYSLPHTDPWAFVVDHIQPLAKGGTDTLDNKQAAHRHCNRQKSDSDPEDFGQVREVIHFETDRTW